MSEPLGKDRNGTPIFKGDLCMARDCFEFKIDGIDADGNYIVFLPGHRDWGLSTEKPNDIWLVYAVEPREVEVCNR